ncbi:MAG TPA: pyridoxal-phosphate dependent enzyme [Pseudonocardiaceae bacterium]|nr:pyridoxal-phosphate dependent enzyme [Pseudonocardiaceae bacterium]
MTDVLRARRVVSAHLPPTPLWSYPALNAATGAATFVKHEHVQPTGAFKVRGGITLLESMTPTERAAGVLGYSTGNHAQSLAYSAALFGAPCTIVMPEHPNPVKAAAVRGMGAELVEFGKDFEAARQYAEERGADGPARLVSSGDEPHLIAGVATAYLEILEREPDLDAIFVPIGGGSGGSGACLVAEAVAPHCRIIGVQSSASPAAHDSWEAGQLVRRDNQTMAEGLATGSGFELPQRILRDKLADFVLVDDKDIRAAQRVLIRDAHTVVEAAGAAALAGLLANRDRFAGQRVAVMCSGGNVSEAELRACLAD